MNQPKLKGYIFLGTSGLYYKEFSKGWTADKSKCHLYSVAEAKSCYQLSIERSSNSKTNWGVTIQGKWIAVWEQLMNRLIIGALLLCFALPSQANALIKGIKGTEYRYVCQAEICLRAYYFVDNVKDALAIEHGVFLIRLDLMVKDTKPEGLFLTIKAKFQENNNGGK